jgi:anti-sigma factor RsiW
MLQKAEHPGDDILVRFVDDELPATERGDVARHVTACAACSTRVDRIRGAFAHFSVAFEAHEESPALTLDRRRRFERAMQQAAAQPTWVMRAGQSIGRWHTQALAAAALVLAAVVVPAVWNDSPSPEAALLAADPLPNPSLTPGAVSAMTAADLCSGARPSRVVAASTRDRVLRAYRMQHVHAKAYELDALITPELGGTTDEANLWPQPYESPVWTAYVKDELEVLLPTLVCRGEVELARAQREIATDWVAAYKRYFKTEVPLRAHLDAPRMDEDELIIVGEPEMDRAARDLRFGPRMGTGILLVSLAR